MSEEIKLSTQRQHRRTTLVLSAERDLELALASIQNEHKPTTAEWIAIVAKVMAREIGGVCKFEIRRERHGNTDKPGDVA